ncbi:NAD-dependent epimerase/dehydratase family protein [Streptomyces sp. TR06-5]|uniref:NAD-dependent epimerase/dehydratase family protein n=1 Tax=unclassified Streptomyces TaxID=2593676 RepID=UPI0039A25D09
MDEGSARPREGHTVAVVGATGNLGTSIVRAASEDPRVAQVLGLARRIPDWQPPKTRWIPCDVTREGVETDLAEIFRSVDVVVHLAWLFQPTHRPALTWRTNVLGALRVFRAAADVGTASVVHASSIGAYSPRPVHDPLRRVDESWPTHGWPEAAYTREKAYLERYLDSYEQKYPWIRVVRMRPAFMFKEESASEQRRLFLGPLLPSRLVRSGTAPLVPDVPGLSMQFLHTDDVAEAFLDAVTGTARGAFNLASEPVVDAHVLAEVLRARTVRIPARAVRAAIHGAWLTRLLPASPQLFDAALRLPLMDWSRARDELNWRPLRTSTEAFQEFLLGLRTSSGMATPPLTSRLPHGGRARELATRLTAKP